MINSQGMNADSGQKTWLTPPDIIRSLGEFDLDPCVPDFMPWKTAKTMYTKSQDGLKQEWFGRVWLNPPYGRESVPFLKRMAEHRRGIALLFERTDTAAWHDLVFPYSSAVMFMRGRIRFCLPDGTPGGAANAPSCLVAYSYDDACSLFESNIDGYILTRAWDGNIGHLKKEED